ncbi:MAG: PAS domain S-box protein [Hydrogenophaga sp.]|nr:PAS domain S-box protein [Hydrogenophaga sp.]
MPTIDRHPHIWGRLLAWRPQTHALWVRLLVAVALTVLAAWMRISLAPAESGGRFITFSLAVVLCTMYGGFFAGIVSTVLGMLLANFFLVEPYGSLVFTDPWEALWLNSWHLITQMVVMGSIALVQRQHRRLQDVADLVQQGHKQLEDTFEHSATGMAHSHIDGRWIRVNQTYCDLVGYTHQEVLGMTFKDFTHPDDIDIDLQYLSRTLSGDIDHYSIEKRYIHKLGHVIWVYLTLSLIRKTDGSPDYLIAVVQDVSRRKAFEEALETSEKLLRQAQNIARMATWQADLTTQHFHLLWGSHNIMRLPVAGLSVGDMIEITHPDDRETMMKKWSLAVQGKQPYDLEYRVVIEGEVRWLSVQADFERDAQGRAIRALGVTYDITARKQAELEVLRLNASLEQRIQARTHALKGAYDELESYSYAVAHDLRSPLRIINGFAMAIKEDNPSLDPDSVQHLERIMGASKKMGELIDGLLKLSQFARGETHRTHVNLSAIAARQLEELAVQEPQRHVTWEIEPGLTAMADAPLIEALLQNLLSNAWKYTAKTANAHLRMYASPRNGQTHFCISDNGAGFDMARIDKLFKPFQRLHMPHEFTGLGIGLATAMRIVQRHGGVLHGESVPGQGATFCFTLPDDHTAVSEEPQIAPAVGQGD